MGCLILHDIDRELPQLKSSPISFRELQDKVSSLNEEQFYDPETVSSSENVPLSQSTLEDSENLVCRNIHGTRRVPQETFLKIHLLQKGHLHRRIPQYRLFDLPGNLRPGILCIILEELILKIV